MHHYTVLFVHIQNARTAQGSPVRRLASTLSLIHISFAVGAIYLNAVTVGIGLSITFVMFNTNRNNIADLIEWQSGRRIDLSLIHI